jgi:hypothetical protein
MADEDKTLFPENLIIGNCYSYLRRPSDYSGVENPEIIQRQSKLIGKRFFERNRRDPMYEMSTNVMGEFYEYITQYNIAIELTFENGDILTVRRSEDEDEREDGTYRDFINTYMFRNKICPDDVVAAGRRKRKQKTKRKLRKYLKSKKSKKRV